MKVLLILLAAVGLLEAKPANVDLKPTFGSMIIGGSNAAVGEFPWQLSQHRLGSHSCGASLLGGTRALSAAHCVDGTAVASLSVIAGMRSQSSTAGTQSSSLTRYVMHENYNDGSVSFANDIAILHLQTTITTGSNIQFATLPTGNSNSFAGTTCVISGWGRTGSSNQLPDILQKANIQVISTAQCRSNIGSIGNVDDRQICVYDSANNIGSCNGDSGGPLNCPSGGNTVVAGVTSWVVSSALGNCLQTYPSVYTRTGSYYSWIQGNL